MSATITIRNNTGSSLDRLALWYMEFPPTPGVDELSTQNALIAAENVAQDAEVSASFDVSSGTCWIGGARSYQNNGGIIGGYSAPYFVLEVPDGAAAVLQIESCDGSSADPVPVTFFLDGAIATPPQELVYFPGVTPEPELGRMILEALRMWGFIQKG